MKYKILTILTMLLPISAYILISAFTGQLYDAEVYKFEEGSTIVFEAYDDSYIIYSEKASYTGYLVPYNESYALVIEKDDIIKVDKDYYTPYFNQETQTIELTNLEDIPPAVKNTNAWTISIASLVALGIAALIIGGKMDLLKKHPRASAFVSLIIITLILYGINSIITDMLNVFIVVTASWGIYCIEYIVHQGNITAQEGDKSINALIEGLRGLQKWQKTKLKKLLMI